MKKLLILSILYFSVTFSKIQLGFSFEPQNSVYQAQVSISMLQHVLERVGCKVLFSDDLIGAKNIIWIANMHTPDGVRKIYCELPKPQNCLDQSLDLIDISSSSDSSSGQEDLMVFE